jgi:ABC-2 type transport system permease protein
MNPTIVRLTLRAMFGRKRALMLVPMPLLLIGLSALAYGLHPDAVDWQNPLIVGLGFAVIVPVVSLIVGTSVVGSEIDDGTIVYILTKPLPRWQIVLSKLLVAAGVTAVVNALMMAVCGGIIAGPHLVIGLAVGAAVASICYSALFVALSLVSRRPVLIGLIYILIWEGLLSNLLTGTQSLSVEQYGITLAGKIAHSPYVPPTLSLPVAVIMSLVFLVGGTAIAIDRLRAFRLAGETS